MALRNSQIYYLFRLYKRLASSPPHPHFPRVNSTLFQFSTTILFIIPVPLVASNAWPSRPSAHNCQTTTDSSGTMRWSLVHVSAMSQHCSAAHIAFCVARACGVCGQWEIRSAEERQRQINRRPRTILLAHKGQTAIDSSGMHKTCGARQRRAALTSSP